MAAAISITSAPRVNRSLRLTRGALVMVMAAVMAPVLVFLLTYLKLFQIIAGK